MVTLNDLMGAVLGRVQSGENADAEALVVTRDDGSLLVDGSLPIDDLRELLGGGALPGEDEHDYHTAAGMVIAHFGRIPHAASISTGTAGGSRWSTSTARASTSCCCSALPIRKRRCDDG